jgi:hypothetical protein
MAASNAVRNLNLKVYAVTLARGRVQKGGRTRDFRAHHTAPVPIGFHTQEGLGVVDFLSRLQPVLFSQIAYAPRGYASHYHYRRAGDGPTFEIQDSSPVVLLFPAG